MRSRRSFALAIFAAAALAACSSDLRRFPLAPPRWEDHDRNHVPDKPASYYSGLYADAIDQTFMRPLADALRVPNPGESPVVNSMDEVPNSAWFQNRIGLFERTPEQVARGPCTEPPLDPQRGPWVVTSAKAEGITPGFFIEDAGGRRYLLKLDGELFPERASTADVVGSRLYHAVGYHAPCNEVVFFERDILELAPDATRKDDVGRDLPLTSIALDRILLAAVRLKDGRLRALASRMLPGAPLGPFRYEGTRADDPNDVFPHEDRRDLRASGLVAAWINHFDIREQNSLDVWVEEQGRRFIRHYQLDFGDSFTAPWSDTRLARPVGHAYYLDLGQVAIDTLTLGLLPRPWRDPELSRHSAIFGYFGWRNFTASKWKPVYPNPAFQRMTWRDGLWMARIIARLTDQHLAAIVAEAKLSDRAAQRFLVRVLARRRDKILREYLTRHVPLARFRVVRRVPGNPTQSICFDNLAISRAGVPHQDVHYKVRMLAGRQLERQLGWLQFTPDPSHPAWSCVQLPVGDTRPADLAPAAAPEDHPLRYGVLRIHVFQGSIHEATRVDLHLYDRGPERGYALVGLRRFDS